MPTIPVYDAPQVRPSPEPGAGLSVSVPNLGAAVGQGLSQAADVMAQVRERADHLVSDDRFNQFRQFEVERKAQLLALQGDAAITPDKDTTLTPGQQAMKDIQAKAQELGQDLGGGAKRLFNQKVTPQVIQFEGDSLAHFSHNQKVAAVQNADGQSGLAAQDAEMNPLAEAMTGNNVKTAATMAERAAETNGFIRGTPAFESFISARTAPVLHAAVQSLIQAGRPDLAKEYFDGHKAYSNAAVTEDLMKYIGTATRSKQMDGLVDSAVDMVKTQGHSWEDAFSALTSDSTYSNLQPHEKAQTRELFREFEMQATKQATRDQQEAVGSVASLWMKGHSMNAVTRSPEWNALQAKDPVQASHFWDYMREQTRALAAPMPATPAQQVARYAAAQQFLDDPKALMGLSDLQIASYTPVLGVDLTTKLMDAKRKFAGNLEGLKSFTLDDIKFTDIAAEYGLKTKGNMTPEDHAKLGLLRDQSITAIRDQQTATGKLLDPGTKEQVVRKLLMTVPTKNTQGSWWDRDWLSHDKPLYQIKSFAELDATGEEKQDAIRYLINAGTDTTPANVQTMIDAMRAKKAGK